MKVLYGINTNGQGHINRARVFIKELLHDGHDVHVLLAGKRPPAYAFNLAPKVFYKPGPIDIYKDHEVALSKTLQANLKRLWKYANSRRELIQLDKKENFDAIFSDFEPLSSTLGKQAKKPVICIDHQHSLFHSAVEEAPGKASDKVGFKIVMNIMLPYYTHCFSIDFTESIESKEDITIFPLVWKQEFDDYEITNGNHFIAYLARYDQQKLIDIFSQFPKETFFVYGFNQNKTIDNIQFKKTSRKGFLEDLVSSRAIIGNAGFNLAWEGCLVKKPLWLIPHKRQFEQITNAYRLQKRNHAFVSERLSVADFQSFVQWIENKQYQPTSNLPIIDASLILSRAYRHIKDFYLDQFPIKREIRRQIRQDVSRWRLRQKIKNMINQELEI